MKKILLLTLAVVLLAACQKEEESNVVGTYSFRVVSIGEHGEFTPLTRTSHSDLSDQNQLSLQFSSVDEYQKFLSNFSSLNSEERIKLTDGLGFVSLEKLFILADEELEQIGETAVSEADFRSKYDQYKNKYSQYFIFNDEDLTDLSPYIPECGNDIDAFLVGINQTVVVGNEVRKISFSRQMREEDRLLSDKNLPEYNAGAVLTRAGDSDLPLNGFTVTVGSKKTIFKASTKKGTLTLGNTTYNGTGLWFHFEARKKMWYGWKSDPARDFAFSFAPAGASGVYLPKSKGKADYRARFIQESPTLTPISGIVYVWTDQTVDVPGSDHVYPSFAVCDNNKAYKAKISFVIN